jgi:hypothetical protein
MNLNALSMVSRMAIIIFYILVFYRAFGLKFVKWNIIHVRINVKMDQSKIVASHYSLAIFQSLVFKDSL